MFWKKEWFKVGFQRVERGFLSEKKGKAIPLKAKDGKGTRIKGEKPDTVNLESESIKGRAESTGGCVKLKT